MSTIKLDDANAFLFHQNPVTFDGSVRKFPFRAFGEDRRAIVSSLGLEAKGPIRLQLYSLKRSHIFALSNKERQPEL